MVVQDIAPARPPDRRPSRARYWFAGLLAIVGVAGSLACTIATQAATSSHADGFVRAGVPGELILPVHHPGTYSVYAEGTLWRRPSVQVTDPDGRAVQVKATSPGPHYYHGGNGGSAVGQFDAVRTGDYRIKVATGSAVQGDFAVGDRFPLWMRLGEFGALALLVIAVGASIVLVVVTIIQRRRSRVG